MDKIQVVILAAGKGTRMYSTLPKVLHTLGGVSLLERIITTAKKLTDDISVICGYDADTLQQSLAHEQINWIYQAKQLGTGHAVSLALPHLDPNKITVILYGDVPLISIETLENLAQYSFGILTTNVANPVGYGRILRNQNSIIGIVEQKDASTEEQAITEINTGIMAVRGELLHKYLPELSDDNAQGELYLTDIVSLASSEGVNIKGVVTDNHLEITGVNTKAQLGELERAYQTSQAQDYMNLGLHLYDYQRFDVRGELTFGMNCSIDVNTIINGIVTLGDNVTIGANCIISNTTIGDNVVIEPHSIIEHATIHNNVNIGPFARIRPHTTLLDNSKIGNFVETKKSTIGTGSKVNHLSYIGDSTIGEQVNIGAGTITCNYDGVHKHHTTIKDRAFIGSNSALVAPVTIGKNALVGAGSVITKDVNANSVAVARGKQKELPNRK